MTDDKHETINKILTRHGFEPELLDDETLERWTRLVVTADVEGLAHAIVGGATLAEARETARSIIADAERAGGE